jgi:hypothetical protein
LGHLTVIPLLVMASVAVGTQFRAFEEHTRSGPVKQLDTPAVGIVRLFEYWLQ